MNSYAQQKKEQPGKATANSYSRSGPHSSERSHLPIGLHETLEASVNLRPQVRHVAQLRQMLNPEEEKIPQEEPGTLQLKEQPVTTSNRTGLPDNLKSGIESLSGISMDGVKVHYNSTQPAQLNAFAYAQGSDIHLASGQEKHLPHEAWHLVQQAQDRVQPTTQLKDGIQVNDDEGLEREADEMGAKAATLVSQRKKQGNEPIPGRLTGTKKRAIQRALIDSGLGYHVDNRDPNRTQHFTNTGGVNWQDQHGYHYQYTPDQEFLITQDQHGVAYPPDWYWDVQNQRELQKQTAIAVNGGGQLHIYVRRGGNVNHQADRNYYNAVTHRYVFVPGARVRWIDAIGQFVDEHERVLAPNSRGVDKQYVVTKEGRNFLIPFKDTNQPFLPGLPGLFGGNINPGEIALAALAREMLEESGNAVVMNMLGGLLLQHQAAAGPDRNRYTIRSATVTTQPQTALPQEMGGMFQVTASQFVGHVANPVATKHRLLALFLAHIAANVAANPALAAYQQPLLPALLNQWMLSHSTTALTTQITQDVASYQQGRNRARASQPALHGANAEYMQGFNMYLQGFADARAGNAVAQPGEPAYVEAHAEYLQGLADARAGNPVAHAGSLAYVRARAEYLQGFADAAANHAPANMQVAYIEGYRNYI